MTHMTKIFAVLTMAACFSLYSYAAEDEQVPSEAQQVQTLELETADFSALRLSNIKEEADQNSGEIHQEATVGRAGLAGACNCEINSNFMCE